jgi:hypothetical protein
MPLPLLLNRVNALRDVIRDRDAQQRRFARRRAFGVACVRVDEVDRDIAGQRVLANAAVGALAFGLGEAEKIFRSTMKRGSS